MKRFTFYFLFILTLVACSRVTPVADPPASPDGVTETIATAEPTAEPGLAPVATTIPTGTVAVATTVAEVMSDTATPELMPTTTALEPVVVSGRTEEGAFFLGAVDAPVTLIDYSDFL